MSISINLCILVSTSFLYQMICVLFDWILTGVTNGTGTFCVHPYFLWGSYSSILVFVFCRSLFVLLFFVLLLYIPLFYLPLLITSFDIFKLSISSLLVTLIYVYNETCLNRTLDKQKSCIQRTLK